MKVNIALTFYGGVSLAVYEAGVAEEFVRFVQFCKSDGRAGSSHGKPDVSVKVISGTSAGGLAAVLMSSALVNAGDPARHLKEMRRIWFDVADLSAIQYLRGQNVRSFLNNDILEEEVARYLQIRPDEKGLSRDIRIILTGTNMQGFFDAIPIEHDFTRVDAYAERVFPTTRHTETFPFTEADIREAATASGEKTRKRISKAARITSTFPAAFPPQLERSPGFPEETLRWYKPEERERALNFWYLDGGVLDNKPLGHAIDAMQTSREEGDWWYFFVEPKPQDFEVLHREWGLDPDNPPDPAAAVASVFETRGAETIYHDLRRLQKINHQVMQINGLIPELGRLLAASPEVSGEIRKACEECLKTSRLHRFLPDYLKCVTIMRYAFLRHGDLDETRKTEIHRLGQLVLEEIRPLDLSKLIVGIGGSGLIAKELPEDVRKRLEEDGALARVIKTYDDAAKRVWDSQLLFRQIAFWVEFNFQKDRRLSDDTWVGFVDAGKSLEDALTPLAAAYAAVEGRIRDIIGDDTLFEKVRGIFLLDEALHAAAGVDTRSPINVVRIYHNEKKHGRLAGAQIANFAGFLDRRWRKNDYLVGMRNAREMLRGRLKEQIPDEEFWKEYAAWREDVESREFYGDEGAYGLGDGDVLKGEEKELGRLPAARLIGNTGKILKTGRRVIDRYEERPFFSAIRKIKVHWLIQPVRLLLWILGQATTNPSQEQGTKETEMRGFLSQGRQYLGFILIGIVAGILISFFLPDAIRDFARWLKETLGLMGIAVLIVIAVVIYRFRDEIAGFLRRLREKGRSVLRR